MNSMFWVVAAALAATLLGGCATATPWWGAGASAERELAVPSPQPVGPGDDETLTRVTQLMDRGKVREAADLLAKAQATRASDELLLRQALVLLSPPLFDPEGAKGALTRLLAAFPDSHHRFTAAGLLRLLTALEQTQAENAAINEDLRKILDIDLETQEIGGQGGENAP